MREATKSDAFDDAVAYGNEFSLFDGDRGDMCADARDAAIALKTRASISGELFEKAHAYLDDVERSLNNDMLLLVVDEHYGVMYAVPVDVDTRAGHYSLKRASYLSPQEAATLVMLRQHVLAYENERVPPEAWLISHDEIEMELTTGSGFLAGRNSEEGVEKRLNSLIERMKGQGYLDATEENDLYLIDPLVAAVVTQDVQERWLALLSGNGEADDAE